MADVQGMRRLGVVLVVLGIVLIAAAMACGGLGGGIETAVPTVTSVQAVEAPTPPPAPTTTQVAPTSTPSPTPPPAPKFEITSSRHTDATEPPPGRLWLNGTITGVLTYEGDQALPVGSRIRIRLGDRNDRYGPVGVSQPFEKPEQFPLPFAFHCDPCEIKEGQEHTASFEIQGPERQRWDHWQNVLRDTLFLNASKVIVVNEKWFAENIEIPVVPPPTLKGTVAPGESENIPVSAAGYIDLLDVSGPGAEPAVLSSSFVEAAAAFPKHFSMTYLPEDIDPEGKYVLEVKLKRFGGEACRGAYRNNAVYEVITGGNPRHDIRLEIIQVDKWVSDELAYVTGEVSLARQHLPSRRNPENPWILTIWDISKGCILAELEVDGGIPGDHGYQRTFNFSIAYDPSHIDPSSSYVVQAYHQVLSSRSRFSQLEGETPIELDPDSPNIHVEVEVHRRGGQV